MYNPRENLSFLLMNFMFWISTIAYLNILWIVGVLLGGIVLGIGPATVAISNILEILIWNRNKDIPIFKTFYHEYKENWKKANKFIFIFYLIYSLLTINYLVTLNFSPLFLPIFLLLLSIVYLTTIYFILFYKRFKHPFSTDFKNIILLPWLFPIQSITILILTITSLILMNIFSVYIVLSSISLPLSSFYYLLRKKQQQLS